MCTVCMCTVCVCVQCVCVQCVHVQCVHVQCVCVSVCVYSVCVCTVCVCTPAAEHVLWTVPCGEKYVLIVRPCLSLEGDTPSNEATVLISVSEHTVTFGTL